LWFLEVDPNVFVTTSTNRYYQDVSSTSFRKNSSDRYVTSLAVPVSIGYGRIEPVQDARLAIYIIEELYKAGRIEGSPSDEVILELAREISKIKAERFFDSRIRKVRELQVIDSFLVANNIISLNDINYFAVLNDQWDYASGPVRETGYSISAGIDNKIIFEKDIQETALDNNIPDKQDNSDKIYRIGGFLSLKYAKPHNLYWQSSASLQTFYNREFTKFPAEVFHLNDFSTNIFRSNINFKLQYLPNSRTSIEASLSAYYQTSVSERSEGEVMVTSYKVSRDHFDVFPGINMYYYFSPQLRVQMNASLNFSNLKEELKYTDLNFTSKDEIRYYRHSISATLIYSFF
jgi:hypothetical protein